LTSVGVDLRVVEDGDMRQTQLVQGTPRRWLGIGRRRPRRRAGLRSLSTRISVASLEE